MNDGLAAIFLEVVALSWRVAWLIGLFMILRALLRRRIAPAMVFAGWLVVAGSLLIPLRVPVPWDPLGLGETAKLKAPVSAARPEIIHDEAPPALAPGQARLIRMEPPDKAVMERMAREGIAFEVFDVEVRTTRQFVAAIGWYWLAGVGALLLVRVAAVVRLHRRLRAAEPMKDERLMRVVREGCGALGLSRIPEVSATALVNTPALCGVLRSRLLFPVGFANRLSEEELRWVVWHELGHLRRRDLAAQALFQLACAVHWFNPLVWLAARSARHDCELACDEFVLRRAHAEDGADYGSTLLKVLGRTQERNRLPATVGIFEGRRQLLKRIASIACYRRGDLRPVLVGAAVLAGFVFVSGTAAENTPAKPQPQESALSVIAASPSAPSISDPAMQAKLAARRAEMEAKQRAMKFDLRAVGVVGGVPVALIDVNGEPTVVTQGSGILAYGVQAIDPQREELVLRYRDEPVRVLTITDPRPVEFPELPRERVEQMLRSPAYLDNLSAYNRSIPAAVIAAWGSIRREAKENILLNYLRSGFVMTYVFQGNTVSASPRRLFDPEIRAAGNNRRLAFIESLSPQQQADYAGGLQSSINFMAPREVQEAQAAAAKARADRQAKVIENLTPDQRALYEAIPADQKL